MTHQKTLKARSRAKQAPVRVGMMSLGCPKTLVDSEAILGRLDAPAFTLVPTIDDCDIALLNTCAFIQDAQQESVDRILELIEMKREGKLKAVVVMGCLVQRFPKELQKELTEVDAFIGSGEYDKISDIVGKVSGGEKVMSLGEAGYLVTSDDNRVALTPAYYRYVKISEGCDHVCTFCTIPSFRGKHRSRTIEDILTEVRRLTKQGAKEIILTGQDTTFFGRDYSGSFLLPELLGELDKIEEIEWIRLLYAYPSCVTSELMDAIAGSKRICRYLDMPLQHASDNMLQAMRRGITQRRTRDLIREFRSRVPGLAIRTTFIVGFPGETEKDFEELLAFMEETRFERAGVFTYSQEAGTPSAALANQIPQRIKEKRRDKAMLLQQKISFDINRALVGRKMKVLIEGHDERDPSLWKGRSYMDAPDVDANVLVQSGKPLSPGSFYDVSICDVRDYDLVGKV